MSVYPLIWVNDVSCNSVSSGFGLHPDHPPRVVGAPSVVSTSVPGRDGEMWTPQGATLPPLFVVTLRVRGIGSSVDDQYANVEQNVALWGRVTRAPRVVLKQQVAASGVGSTLYAEGRLMSLTRERESGVLVHEKVTMTFQVTGAFWSDQPPGTPSFTFSQVPAVSGTKYVVDSVASTAPLLDAQIRITGPATNPRYTDFETGDWVQYNGTVSSGQQLRLDLAKFKAWLSSSWVSSDWTSSGVIDASGSMFIGGNASLYSPTMVRLTPRLLVSAGVATLTGIEGTLTGTGFTSATKLEVRGRRAHA